MGSLLWVRRPAGSAAGQAVAAMAAAVMAARLLLQAFKGRPHA